MKPRASLLISLVCLLFAALAIAQTYPQWWLDQSVVTAQPPAAPGAPGHDPATYDAWMADNYAVANLGQAKNLAASAMNAMEAATPGSSGASIPAMIGDFSAAPEDNYVPLNIGQLKALSAPFYNRMHSLDYPVVLEGDTTVAKDTYPWIEDVTPDNLAVANLGQLKHVFSFDLTNWNSVVVPSDPDSDGDGLTDSQELAFGSDPNLIHSDADSLDDYQEFHIGTDPNTPNTVSNDTADTTALVLWMQFR